MRRFHYFLVVAVCSTFLAFCVIVRGCEEHRHDTLSKRQLDNAGLPSLGD